MTRYEKNKLYPTRNGDKAIIYDLNYEHAVGLKPRMLGKVMRRGHTDVVRHWNENGKINPYREDVSAYTNEDHPHDIMAGYSSFQNVYCDYVSEPHGSREEADKQKMTHRLGVVEISVCEGEITTVVHK